MSKKLTERAVKTLTPPATGNRVHWDTEVKGFGVRITANGSVAFFYNYRTRGGRMRRYTIGSYPTYSVEAARVEARKLAQVVHRGGDPLADKEAEREAETFKDLADHYIERHLPKKRVSSATVDLQTLNNVLLPQLGKLKVAEITYHDIDGIHDGITKAGRPYRANRVVALLSKMFSIAIKKGWRTDNPAKGVEHNQEHKRVRYLKNGELARLIEALANYADQDVANAVRLLLMTGARRGEVLTMTWDQIDFEAGTWTKPGATTKQKTEHVVPLSPPALQLLVNMKDASTSDYVFPGRNGGHRVDLKKPWPIIIKAANIEGLRLHDLRHSYASFLASSGHSLPVIGALLGHTQAATTARYAHLFDETLRKATTTVGAMIAGKPSAEVVKMRRRSK